MEENIYPKLSIVMPSLNQAAFLEQGILSVISQGYPNLEFVIIDGGSDDGSVDIIRKYEKYLHYWVSEKDRGQSHALNKGFEKTTGEIMAYLNSDDLYCPWTFRTVVSSFSDFPSIRWLTSLRPVVWNGSGEPIVNDPKHGFTRHAFYSGRTLGCCDRHIGWIMQEVTFWKRSLWDESGGHIAEDYRYAMDFELWARFYEHSELVGINVPLGGFRRHGNQKSADLDKYYAEASAVLDRYKSKYGNNFQDIDRQRLVIGYDWQQDRRILHKWGENYLDELSSLKEENRKLRKKLDKIPGIIKVFFSSNEK
ncbi:MAG: glycosyltransferase [Nitrospirae bacterium]|nr:glycosyltransferase [Nitrospirota bacterium]